MSDTIPTRVVYIVDSDESVLQALSRLVSSAGLETRPCDSIDVLLRETAETRPACALLDVSSLRLGEGALWSRLRAMAMAMPFIALSARDDPEARRTARALGAQAFFRKPVDAAALLDSIDWVTQAEARETRG
jgi:FixJ family two-component response regulator